MSIESVRPSNHLILCHLLLLPEIFPSIRVISNESVLHIKCPRYWSFSFSIIPSNEYSGLISFRMDGLDLLTVQGSLKSLQFKSISSSTLSFLCGPTLTSIHNSWKNHSLDYVDLCWQSNVSAFICCLVGHRFYSKGQASFNFMAAVTICSDFGAPKNKVCHCFHCFPIYLPWGYGTRGHDLSFLNVEIEANIFTLLSLSSKDSLVLHFRT